MRRTAKKVLLCISFSGISHCSFFTREEISGVFVNKVILKCYSIAKKKIFLSPTSYT